MANLIVCCDGTWNTADQKDEGVLAPTNVYRLFNAAAEEKKYYHPGVGTEGGAIAKILGGSTGSGLDRNIKSAYAWLADNYAKGDQLFLFGFSRGAYTVRSLAGWISCCGLLDIEGLPDQEKWQRIDTLYDEGYRQRDPKKSDQLPLKQKALIKDKGWSFHDSGTPGPNVAKNVPIYLIGVWDTVGALGVPDEVGLLNIFDSPQDRRFHDTNLSRNVIHARHAVALDEMRESFMPTLWTNVDNNPNVQQVWFSGVHSDVGGGYAQKGLSDLALDWMLTEAGKLGMKVAPNLKDQIGGDAMGMLHDSYSGVFKALRSRPRNVPSIHADNVGMHVHESVLRRQQTPSLVQGSYRATRLLAAGESASLKVYAREKWNATGLYLEAGVTYDLTAAGEWLDSDIKATPDGSNDGQLYIGEIAQALGTVLGQAEKLFKSVLGNQQIDVKMTRREEAFDWFALIGVIANGIGVDDDGNGVPHQTFKIGTKARVTPAASGYLYCFANDAWDFYDNNRGQVKLTVQRL